MIHSIEHPMLTLPRTVIEAIENQAIDAYPNECCGAFLGKERKVSRAIAIPNTAAEEPRRRYFIDPMEYLRVEKEARASDEEFLAIYHSHPDHPARPSQYDLDHAWPGIDYVIAAVTSRGVEDITAWRLDARHTRFEEVRLSCGGRPYRNRRRRRAPIP